MDNTQSRVTISQCKFIDNRAMRGGAIYITSSSIITIQHSTFIRNRAGYTFSNFGGGSIYVSGSSSFLFIQQSRFMNNQLRNGNGGVIYVAGFNNSLSINQSEFINNRIDHAGHGGAIYVNGGNNSLSIYQSTIEKK